MTEHEESIRKLKKGDVICYCGDGENEIIKEVIFDNNKGDIRAEQGDRVTINGLHWNITDVTIVSCNATLTSE